eukprot:872890-Karenia_brevis.AAC.1
MEHWKTGNADSQLLKDLHIVLQSLKNGYGDLVKYLGQWLCSGIVEFTPGLPANEIDVLFQLYTVLGLQPEDADSMANNLQLMWSFADSKLLVWDKVRDAPEDLME